MITINQLKELRDAQLDENTEDYLPGIELDSLQYFDESVFLYDINSADDDYLTEGVGATIWEKIKSAFRAIVKFFKMLGAKIANFIRGFFSKAEEEIKTAEKDNKDAAPSEAIKTLTAATEKVADIEKKIENADESDKEVVEELHEELAEAKEEVAKIRRKYNLSRKSYETKKEIDTISLYNSGGFIFSAGIRRVPIDVFLRAVGNSASVNRDTAFSHLMSSDFIKCIDYAKEDSEDTIVQTYVNRLNSEILSDAKKMLSAKIDYSDEGIMKVMSFRKINGKLRSGFIEFKQYKNMTRQQVIDLTRKLIVEAKKIMANLKESSKNATESFEKLVSKIDSYQKDGNNAAYAEALNIQSRLCNKGIGVINKFTSLHSQSFREAIQYNTHVLKQFN